MIQLYLSRKEIGPALGTTEKKAREILSKYGVKPVDFGMGRGNGLRWRTSAVINIADTLHAEAQAIKAARRRKPHAPHPIQGRSNAEVYADFNRGNAPVH